MYQGRTVFSQILDFLPMHKFRQCVNRYIAISVYVLVAIMKKRMKINHSLYTILQILSITLLEKKPILQVFTTTEYQKPITTGPIQLNLFEN